MAKAKAAPAPVHTNADSITVGNLTAVLRRKVADLKRPILEAARDFGTVREKLATLAPKMMEVFNAILATHVGFTFVEFARMIDPSIPTNARDRNGEIGYQNHKTYNACTYMKRLTTLKGGGTKAGGVRNSAADALARSIATVLQILPQDKAELLWKSIQVEFGYGERIMSRLRKRTDEIEPLFTLSAKSVNVGAPIHAEHVAPAEPLAQPGKNVRMPAAPAGHKLAKTGTGR